ncbi:MAG: mucoidy inhibitor MuiA family protein [Nitrospinae bacterium]|nr:mucoidy inhibitor MuiA family protein [Nitrospinota bacterium]
MKYAVLAITSFVLIAQPSHAEIFEQPGRIESVTVYPDRAAVTRAMRLTVAPGAHTLMIPDLPGGVKEDSLRVSAKSSADVVIENVSLAPRELTEAANQKTAALERAVEEAAGAVALLDRDIAARQAQADFIARLAKTRADEAGENLASLTPKAAPTVEELGRILDFIYTRKRQAEEAVVRAQRERDRAFKELERARRELENQRSQGRARLMSATIEFRAAKPGEALFSVEYLVPGAGWAPAYRVRANDDGAVEITYQARVGQRTGEDWRKVKLRLSTATPSAGAAAPEPWPWVVGGYEPAPMLAPAPARAMPEMHMKSQAAGAPPHEADMAEAEVAATSVTATGTAITFDTPREITIPSGGERVMAPIARLEFTGERSYFSVPRQSPLVFLRTKFENTSEYPLLAGAAQVFQGDSYMGPGVIKTTAPGQKVEMELGADQGFKIERKLIKKVTAQEGTFSRTVATRHIYAIELAKHKPSHATVEVVEALPLPSDQRIKLTGVKLTPEPEKRDERNLATWKLPLKPREKRTVRIEFTLESPAELILRGD